MRKKQRKKQKLSSEAQRKRERFLISRSVLGPLEPKRERKSRAMRLLREMEIDYSKKRKRSMVEKMALAGIGFAIGFAFLFSSIGGIQALALALR